MPTYQVYTYTGPETTYYYTPKRVEDNFGKKHTLHIYPKNNIAFYQTTREITAEKIQEEHLERFVPQRDSIYDFINQSTNIVKLTIIPPHGHLETTSDPEKIKSIVADKDFPVDNVELEFGRTRVQYSPHQLKIHGNNPREVLERFSISVN